MCNVRGIHLPMSLYAMIASSANHPAPIASIARIPRSQWRLPFDEDRLKTSEVCSRCRIDLFSSLWVPLCTLCSSLSCPSFVRFHVIRLPLRIRRPWERSRSVAETPQVEDPVSKANGAQSEILGAKRIGRSGADRARLCFLFASNPNGTPLRTSLPSAAIYPYPTGRKVHSNLFFSGPFLIFSLRMLGWLGPVSPGGRLFSRLPRFPSSSVRRAHPA